jgi:GTPase Era involved in 16S rRNA processing
LKQHWLQQIEALDKLSQEEILPAAFALEAQAVKQAIESFKLTVPLVGKFSAGKSTLLNTWLGQELQRIDLEPCTDIATEFYYAQAQQQKLVVHWQSGAAALERQEYPLQDYDKFKQGQLAAGRQAQFVELHVYLEALARHPDLILVDTPGLGSNDQQHMLALANYLGDSTVFILCVTRTSQVGTEELAFVNRQRALGQQVSLLVCQEDLNNISERENIRRAVAEQIGLDSDQLVRGCSARAGDLSGFEDILTHVEQQKSELFKMRIEPQLQQLMQKAERMIRQQLAQDTSADELREKQKAITQGIEHLQAIWSNEEQTLLQDCRGSVARQVNADVANFLHGRRGEYASQLVNGSSIGSLLSADAQNATQLAIEQRLNPRLLEAAQKLGREVQTITGSVDLAMEVMLVQLDANINAEETQILSFVNQVAPLILMRFPHPYVAAGVAIITTIANLLGSSNSKENLRNQAEGKASEAIEHLIGQLKGQIEPLLEERGRHFLNELRQRVEEQLTAEQQNIAHIETQILANVQERKAIEQKVQAALAMVNQLLQS